MEFKWKDSKKDLLKHLQFASNKHYSEIEKAMKEFSLRATRDAKKNAPVASGGLRSSISPFMKAKASRAGVDMRAGVTTNKIYARMQEEGSKGGKAPRYGNLVQWARMKGYPDRGENNAFKVARRVQKTIKARGVTKTLFIKKAFQKNVPKLENDIEKIMRKLLG